MTHIPDHGKTGVATGKLRRCPTGRFRLSKTSGAIMDNRGQEVILGRCFRGDAYIARRDPGLGIVVAQRTKPNDVRGSIGHGSETTRSPHAITNTTIIMLRPGGGVRKRRLVSWTDPRQMT